MANDQTEQDLYVEVTDDGEWKPSVGAATNAQAKGVWQVAPEIHDMMVLRRMGGPTTRHDRSLLLAGVIQRKGAIADILTLIHMSGMDGALHITSDVDGDEVDKVLFFRRGVYLAGTSSLLDDRLGSVLVQEGFISPDQRDACMADVAEGARLGTVLVAKKLMNTPQVYEGLRKQGEQVFYSTLAFDNGHFRLIAPLDMTAVPSMLRLNVQNLLLEGMRRLDEQQRASEELEIPEELHRAQPVADAELPDDSATKIIDVYNDALSKLFAALPTIERVPLHAELRDYVRDCVPFRDLFDDVGVRADGTLDDDKLHKNVHSLAANPLRTLQEALNELFFFIMFAADEVVSHQLEVQLQHDVARALSRLPRPKKR